MYMPYTSLFTLCNVCSRPTSNHLTCRTNGSDSNKILFQLKDNVWQLKIPVNQIVISLVFVKIDKNRKHAKYIAFYLKTIHSGPVPPYFHCRHLWGSPEGPLACTGTCSSWSCTGGTARNALLPEPEGSPEHDWSQSCLWIPAKKLVNVVWNTTMHRQIVFLYLHIISDSVSDLGVWQ